MLLKPESCKPCPLYGDGKGYVPDEIVPDSELFVMLQNPGGDEEHDGRPAIGKAGKKLDSDFIPLSGLRRGEVSVGNVCKCRWTNPRTGLKGNDLPSKTGVWNAKKKAWDKKLGEKVEEAAAAHCLSTLTVIPDRVRLIVAAGDVPWHNLGQPGSVSDWRGFIGLASSSDDPHKVQGFRDRPVLGTYHPAYLLHQPRMTIPVMCDWKRVKAYLDGEWPKPVPTVIQSRYLPPMPEETVFVEIDTEYDPETYEVGMYCVMYFGVDYEPITAVQILRSDMDYGQTRYRLAELISVRPVVGHNVIAELLALNKLYGLKPTDYLLLEDTIQQHALLQSEWPHGLDFLESIHGRHHRMKHLYDIHPSLYNWGDGLTGGYAFKDLTRQLLKDRLSANVYRTQNIPLVPVRYEAKQTGIALDQSFLSEVSHDLARRIIYAQEVAEGYAGTLVNLGSHDQLTQWLRDVEGIKLKKKKGSESESADKDAIAELRRIYLDFDPDKERDGITPELLDRNIIDGGHPILEARAAYQSASQLYQHYIVPLLSVKADKGVRGYDPEAFRRRVYADQHTHPQASGRWSTQNPPLPTFPKKLRKAIRPPDGYCIVKYDADQQELRLNAHLANDEPTLEAFTHGWDIHTLNTCDVFLVTVPPDRCDPHGSPTCEVWRAEIHWEGKDDKRRVFCKRFVYRLIYRGDPRFAYDIPGAKAMGLTQKGLVEASKNYLGRHPRLLLHWARLDAQVRATRVVRSFGGRKRYLNGSLEAKPGMVPAPCREGTNHPIQSGGVDWNNLLILRLWHESKDLGVLWGYGAHDSHNWLVPLGNENEYIERVKTVTADPWDVDGRPLLLPVTIDPVIYPLT